MFTLLLALLVPAYAFRGVVGPVRSTSSALFAKSKAVPFLEAPKNLEGLVGDKGFDPIGFSDFIDPRFLREAELKHGRVAMLATLGFIVADFMKLPGSIHAVSSIDAHTAAVGSGAMVQILAFVSALEFVSVIAVKEMLDGSGRQPGDYGFDPLGYSNGKPDKVKADLALKELENGRLAMVAFSGIVTQAVVTNHAFPYL